MCDVCKNSDDRYFSPVSVISSQKLILEVCRRQRQKLHHTSTFFCSIEQYQMTVEKLPVILLTLACVNIPDPDGVIS